jgi:AcrR family transcriptional regulator
VRKVDPEAHARVRGRILDAARALFAQKGFHACSMNDVARRAGLGKAAIYHYFVSKQALLQALHADLWAQTEARLAGLPRFKNLREALLYAGTAYLAHFEDPKALAMTRIVFNMGEQDHSLRESAVALVRPNMEAHIQAAFGPFFKGGVPTGQIHLFAMQFFGSLFYHVFVLRSLCPGGDLPVTQQEYLTQLVDIYAAGARQLGGRP